MAPHPTMQTLFIRSAGILPAGGLSPAHRAAATAALHSPFHSYQLVSLTDLFRDHRSKQTIGIVERVIDHNPTSKQRILQGRGNRMDRSGSAFAHPLSAAVAVRGRRFNVIVFHLR